MANYSSQSQFSTLENKIKTIVKTELEKSVTTVYSAEEQKKIPTLSGLCCENITKQIIELVENPMRDKKLEILYNHEKKYLETLKNYKEEIKFATSLQAEIRKEQSTFFASTLKEVCISLKETQIDPKCQIQWIYDLVESYTSSLKISSQLAEEHVVALLGEIQKETSETVNKE